MRKCRFCAEDIQDAATVCPHCRRDLIPGRTTTASPPAAAIATAPKPAVTRPSDRYCANCGTIGTPKTRTKGSFLIEVVLWLCMIFPGIIYSLWRLTSRDKVCPNCGATNMIPVDSPAARAALAK
jgi:RNA polymerase subunit RPABC4/transcription elongation factor Spt4